ncbi:LacI family transcriptional regulator [Enterobacter sp. 10-1]|uniref:LacI family DNA-binding transcriptional regulator n=1 Tax=Raoultella sp. 10-1 TaxID=2683201 RepID=UPI000BA3A4A3|nr:MULTISPECIES: LacI family DNA-binding transcriptional regulator [Enterobacteriaceae]MVT02406.1 LacI family DNA-binding transcriptional regulator [Raoultella sp. 10-1]PAC14894.1 LacI family transcriptional regulator [Enterobacter sp. 10-1]
MATIKDVAEKAGLSVTTVSRFLNNHPYISDDKKEKILAAMKALDYEPSTVAQQMRGVKTHRIGVLISRITNPFFASLVDALEVTARKNGYSVLIVQNHDSAGEEKNCLDLLKKKIIDGLILCAVESNKNVLEKYQQYGPILLCNTSLEATSLPVVKVDDRRATYNAVTYLINKGYKNIAYSTGGTFGQKGHGSRRNQGFIDAMQAGKLDVDPELIFRQMHTYKDGQGLAAKMLQMKASARPDAIFAGSDEVACGLIAGLTAGGVNVPADLAVVGFDNLPVAEMINVPLTTVSQPIEQLGRISVERLLALIAGTRYQYDKQDLQSELIIRASA